MLLPEVKLKILASSRIDKVGSSTVMWLLAALVLSATRLRREHGIPIPGDL
jgi:hypothetical protein